MRYLLLSFLAFGALIGCNTTSRSPGAETDAGCSGSSCDERPDSGVGLACTRNADCPSNICVSLDGGRSFCTTECMTSETDCQPGWECSPFPGASARLCQCAPTTEACDGLDNDCDGIVDNHAVTDSQCAVARGHGSVCSAGACTAPACQTSDDCFAGQICNAQSRCEAASPSIRVCLLDEAGNVLADSCSAAGRDVATVEFGTLRAGQTLSRLARVFNDGTAALSLIEAHVESDVPDFRLTGSPVSDSLAPQATRDLELVFQPSASGEEAGWLIIPTNDPAQPSIRAPLHGTGQAPSLCVTPNPVDFGSVPIHQTATQTITVTNCGDMAANITELSLLNDGSDTVFTSTGGMAAPFQLLPGASFTIDVQYAPIYIEQAPTAGDSGYLSVKSEFVRLTIPITGRGTYPACNDGGQNLTPSGVIVVKDGARVVNPATETFGPLTNITLDGSTSSAPAPEQISQYQWRIVSQPAGSVAHLVTVPNTHNAKNTLYTEVVGDYVVELVVATTSNCQSTPVTVTLHVASLAAVRVQVTWPQAYGDVDLHYVGPGGTFYANTTADLSDLDWTHSLATAYGTGTPTPTGQRLTDYWGLNNTCHPDGTTSNDATFDVDQRSGYGPENVTHNHPFDGTYTVYVHYYCNGSGTTVSPVLNLYVNGASAWHGSMPGMTTRQVWKAAEIVVSNNGTSIQVVPLSEPLMTDTHGC